MKVDQSNFSHVSISWKSSYLEREIVYQASGLAVNFCEGARFRQEHEIIKELTFSISEDTQKKVIQFAMDRAGVPYSIKQVFGIAYIKLLKLFKINENNPFSDGRKAYVCCELVAEILKELLNFDIKDNLDNLTPRELYQLLTTSRTV